LYKIYKAEANWHGRMFSNLYEKTMNGTIHRRWRRVNNQASWSNSI